MNELTGETSELIHHLNEVQVEMCYGYIISCQIRIL